MKTSSPVSHSSTHLRIERIVPNGYGIGFADGLTVFTPLTAPGDVIDVNITQKKKKIAFAEVGRILEPSTERIVPPCKYFGTCGGCDFQQMNYAAQLAAKADIVRDCLKRIGKIEWAGQLSVVPSPHDFQYRSRAQWHLDATAKKIGYLKRNSHEVISIETCPILVPELDAELHRLRAELPWEEIWDNNARIDATAGDDGVISTYSDELNEATNEIVSKIGEDKFTYSARAFFQGNKYMAGQLVEAALGGATGNSAMDLYCGVGLFTLPMARKFVSVTAVEENDAAVGYAEKNAIAAQLDNIQFWAASVRSFLKSNEVKPVEFLLLDPPRSGAEPETILALARLRPKEVSYVSCEPSILARDLRILIDHRYEIATITAFDLFPQTHHVETVVRLALK